VILASLLAAACTTTEAQRPAAEQLRPGSAAADSFRIVDCLLPPQIMKRGGQAVFLGPSRAIKTSARDCEIRGGAYIADYATALRYYLPQAKDGDPVAQTYVGEFFEKGLEGGPDYAAAADWYTRAAEKGYARAAINLGVLYERGLGVPKDPRKAVDWYRRAAGLPRVDFDEASAQAAEELRRLRGRADRLESALKERQAEVDSLHHRLAEARSEQGGNRRELERKELQDRLTRAEASLASQHATYERQANELRAIIDKQRKEIDARGGGVAGSGSAGAVLAIPPPPGISFGTYHALLIGISEYRHLPPVHTAVRDAEEIARNLRDQYGFRVKLQTDPRGDQIMEEIAALRERLKRDDNLLIYYAGRCELERESQSGYWLPFDAQPGSRDTWIPTDEIARNLLMMQASQVIVVADSCYQPRGTPSAIPRLIPPFSGDGFSDTIRKMARQRSRLVLTSGVLSPEPASPGGPHSAFAQALLQVLQENSGLLVGERLFRSLQVRMPPLPPSAPGSEGPDYAPIKSIHEGGDFIFVRTTPKAGARSAPDPSPIVQESRG
jgi:uncharacterized protein